MLPRQTLSALLVCGLIRCLWPAAFAAEPAFTFTDGALTIRTERYVAVWRDGCIVRLRSVLPQADEFTMPTMPMTVGQVPNGLGSFHGQDVVLSLALDCGKSGFNTSCDEAVWGDVDIVEQP